MRGPLGGLADYATSPADFAIALSMTVSLINVLKPLSSDKVTTIVGFTEITNGGRLFATSAGDRELHRVDRYPYGSVPPSPWESIKSDPIDTFGSRGRWGSGKQLTSHGKGFIDRAVPQSFRVNSP